MIRHCVFVRLRSGAAKSEWSDVMQALARLVEHLPGSRSFTAGPNVSPETGMDKGFSEGFIIDFEDEPARDRYLADSEHQEIGRDITRLAEGAQEGVFVFDLGLSPRVG